MGGCPYRFFSEVGRSLCATAGVIVDERTTVHAEFWNLKRVTEITGISKSEVYRQMRLGLFPKSNAYRASPKKRFWLSNDVKRWQQEQMLSRRSEIDDEIDNDFDALLE
jgi:predicted DNA-binding transcriptional regulator AlpA